MIINKTVISKLDPCKDRFDNFLEKYPDFNGNLDSFLNLTEITYSDKMWVGVRVLTINQEASFSILCADSVLHIFEERFPEDKKPRELLEYLKTIKDFENLKEEEREKIRALRNAAATAAADAAAAGAASATAAAYATNAASYATNAAYDDNAASVAAAAGAYNDRTEQEELNLTFLIMVAST